jgi:phosphohistidine phosphatase
VRIVLFRHGIAIDRTDPDCPADRDRELTETGLEKTRAAARGLVELGLHPDQILSSPWSRARQTAEIAASELGFDPDRIEFTEALLPYASPSTVLHELVAPSIHEYLLTGHAPHLDELLDELTGVGNLDRARLKKAGAAAIEIADPTAGHGRLVWMIPPRELRRLGGN